MLTATPLLGNAFKTNKEKIKTQLEELWRYAQSAAAAELPNRDPTEFKDIKPETLEHTVDIINEALKDKPVDPIVSQKLKYAKKNWPSNLKKYEQQEKILNQRSSYSKQILMPLSWE